MQDIGQLMAIIAATFAVWMLGAIIVVGLIQTAKNALGKVTLPSWAWALIMLAVSIGVAFARSALTGTKPAEGQFWTGLGIAAVSQICYESIYRGIVKRGAKFADDEPPTVKGFEPSKVEP